MEIPALSDIKRAHQRIERFIQYTPVFTSDSLNTITGANLYFKCENFQKTGSFKLRGATNAVLSVRPEERSAGFATHSSGNHGQALAYAAKIAEVPAYIVMPENASKVKIKAVEGYGAEIVLCKPTEADRVNTCNEVIKKTGAALIPPFHDPRIIAGQATAAKELIEDTEDLDYLLTPVGGGGLAAGSALAVKYLTPSTKFIIGEPKNADDTYRSFREGKVIPVKNPDTIADGLRVTVGQLNFEIIKDIASDIVTITEEEIMEAMKLVWERMKIIIEPSSAVPFAVVLKQKNIFEQKNVGIIFTGGNVDMSNLPF